MILVGLIVVSFLLVQSRLEGRTKTLLCFYRLETNKGERPGVPETGDIGCHILRYFFKYSKVVLVEVIEISICHSSVRPHLYLSVYLFIFTVHFYLSICTLSLHS